MNVLIAHSDEQKVNQLTELIAKVDHSITLLKASNSHENLMLFCANQSDDIDVIICETNLDGQPVFDVTALLPTTCKVIYTSSNKEDAYEAIRANGIDFLLEPFDIYDVSKAISKAKDLKKASKSHEYKKRFIIKFGEKIQYRKPEEISFFYADGKMAFMITRQPVRKYIVEYTLDELEKSILNPSNFYRINRKFIVNIDCIEEARQYVNSRLKLTMNPGSDQDMIVSREKVADFKNWLNL